MNWNVGLNSRSDDSNSPRDSSEESRRPSVSYDDSLLVDTLWDCAVQATLLPAASGQHAKRVSALRLRAPGACAFCCCDYM